MNILGILIGAIAFVIIGVFHPIVVQAEYRFGTRIWPVFLLVGILALVLSLFVDNVIGSAALGIFCLILLGV